MLESQSAQGRIHSVYECRIPAAAYQTLSLFSYSCCSVEGIKEATGLPGIDAVCRRYRNTRGTKNLFHRVPALNSPLHFSVAMAA